MNIDEKTTTPFEPEPQRTLPLMTLIETDAR
jgi:hypothetical protein